MAPPIEALPVDTEAQEGTVEDGQPAVPKKHLSNGQRKQILHSLLSKSTNNKLEYGAISSTAKEFRVSRQCVAAIWQRGVESVASGAAAMVVDHKKTNCGRKKKDYSQQLAQLASLPLSQRSTIRSTAHHLGVSTWAVWNMTKNGAAKRHSSTIKPTLTATQKENRIDYAIRQFEPALDRCKTGYDVIHVDEKWFYMKQVKQTFYLAANETPPTRTTRNKRFIDKVMFFCAVARPRHDSTSNTSFDGKIGIWPFIEMVPAQRNSRNRPAGTLEPKNVSVTKEVYHDMIVNKLLPAIQAKWPANHRNIAIRIQQDNAKPHGSATNDNETFREAVQATGMQIYFDNQPSNSPDTNILDLGFFNSIQALQQQKRTQTIAELIDAVQESFAALDKVKLENCFMTHQAVCREIILDSGNNAYKLPHLAKERQRRRNALPIALPLSQEVRDKIRQLRPALQEGYEFDLDDIAQV